MRPVRAKRLRWAFALSGLTLAVGCSRAHYYEEADREVTRIVQEKSYDPRWALDNFSIDLDPRSRYFDPYNQLNPPMPEDDPDSHALMHCVDCKLGAPCWHRDGDRPELENPTWRDQLGSYVDLTEDGQIRLDLNSAMRLARVNSPDYQEQLETLYLSALDVSTERFRFDVQFFGGNDTFFTHNGRLRTGAGETNTLTTNSGFTAQKRFAGAGELLVGFANSFVWQFAGPDTNATNSLVNFNLVQPLLRLGGRERAMEQLTIVERGMLANLRAFERYRQGFYTQLAVGSGNVGGPQRRGGFFGGTGLTGFTGTGAGGIGGVGGSTFRGGGGGVGGGTGAAGGLAGGGAGNVGGFIGLLQTLQGLRNAQDSLDLQLQSLSLLESLLQGGRIDLPQVEEFRQRIETARATLLQDRNGYESSLDQFKTSILGLPPNVDFVLDDSLIRQFQFIDRPAIEIQNDLAALRSDLGDLPEDASIEDLRPMLERSRDILQRLDTYLVSVPQDFGVLRAAMPQRREGLAPNEQAELEETVQGVLDNWENDVVQLYPELRPGFEAIEMAASTNDAQSAFDQLVIWLGNVAGVLNRATLVQARARLESVVLEPVTIEPEVALEIARANRQDWANNRASLVDTWRLITFNVDALQSDFNIVFSGDLGTQGNNPVAFRAPTGQLRAGVQFDAPFTRLLERNNFRQSLIDYQQVRRSVIQFEDGVHFSMRNSVRQLKQLEVNMEIQRRAAAIAIRRVDLTREDLSRPPGPSDPAAPQATDPTAAQRLSQAITDLGATQNNFMSVWLNYYAVRMQLIRDMGIMELDENGMWIDRPLEFATLEELQQMHQELDALPPDVPQEWFDLVPEEVPPGNSAPKKEGTADAVQPSGEQSTSPVLIQASGPRLDVSTSAEDR